MSRVPILSSLPSPLGSNEESIPPFTVHEYVELSMSGGTGERSFADIFTSIRDWVIHSKPIPSLFTQRIKGGLGALGQTSILKKSRQGIPLIAGRFAPLAQLDSFSRFF
ncbi:hypothetical protein ES319_D04G105100v1 [Gossypium barbadense]|uniref:Photosystem II cytochrome b559 alpha subunit lumenal region domain-containing protein n=2 Tax=Gossypium TaxID=3633 RepID=A0A5J5RWJ4_GOSBA|nr:hypothetical protein ES319_D04G105100v1 [Gossypium barbadense]TYG73567.1 hypothetical protein ES288_D04G112400v1 [Gossypium darwinii]